MHREVSSLPGLFVPTRLTPALLALLEAYDYAIDARSDRWDFAVMFRHVRNLGLNDTDLRWLVRKGFVEHRREVTVQGLNGREFRPTGDLTFSRRTCLILTDSGAEVIRSINGSRDGELGLMCSPEPAPSPETGRKCPDWDAERRELRMNGHLVKRFKWQAANQEMILNTFQEEGWPARIDDPLPPQRDVDPKRRLSDTIKCLNRRQSTHLVVFRGDGAGVGIVWEQTNGVSLKVDQFS